MTRLRKLIANVLLMIPVLVFSTATPIAGSVAKSATSPAPGNCVNVAGRWYCY